MDKRREGKRIIPAKKSTKIEERRATAEGLRAKKYHPTPQPQEGLTEEQERLLAVIKGVVASYSCKVCDKCAKAMATEIYLKAVILGFKSPQEVKEQVKQARAESFEAGLKARRP